MIDRLKTMIGQMRSAVQLSQQFNAPVADRQLISDWANELETLVAGAVSKSQLREALSDLVDTCYIEGTSSTWKLCGVCQTEHHIDALVNDQTHEKDCAVDEAEKLLRAKTTAI